MKCSATAGEGDYAYRLVERPPDPVIWQNEFRDIVDVTMDVEEFLGEEILRWRNGQSLLDWIYPYNRYTATFIARLCGAAVSPLFIELHTASYRKDRLLDCDIDEIVRQALFRGLLTVAARHAKETSRPMSDVVWHSSSSVDLDLRKSWFDVVTDDIRARLPHWLIAWSAYRRMREFEPLAYESRFSTKYIDRLLIELDDIRFGFLGLAIPRSIKESLNSKYEFALGRLKDRKARDEQRSDGGQLKNLSLPL